MLAVKLQQLVPKKACLSSGLLITTLKSAWKTSVFLMKMHCSTDYTDWMIPEISIPYHGWHEHFNPPPLPSEIPKCSTPPPIFLFDCLKFLTNRKLVLFPVSKKVLFTIFSQAKSKSSLSMFNAVHCSFPF